MIKTIIILILVVVVGVLMGFPISKILIKRYKRKITNNSAEKILNQNEVDLQTLSGKPVKLNFKNDGKEVDLKKQVKEEQAKTKIKEIKEFKEDKEKENNGKNRRRKKKKRN